jgi:hypothetical protein
MRTIVVLGVAGAMLLSGCASTSGGIALMQPESTPGAASVRVGPARVVDAHINPLARVRMATEGDAIVVRFSRPGHMTAVARLDSTSFDELSMTTEPVDHSPVDARPGPTVLGGGRFIVCWKTGDAEKGYRAVAQAFNTADGSPQGPPVVISPPDLDVIGTPRAIQFDGHRAVATFEASIGESFALFAVSIEVI